MNLFNTSASIEEQLHFPLFSEKGIEVWMKRDDLLHPFISGNKFRKLKYLVEDAISKGKKHLVTFGGAYSNHLVATANAGAAFGLKTTGIVRGNETFKNPMLALCKLFGMEMLQVSRDTFKNKDAAYRLFFYGDTEAYRIEEGGYSTLGSMGCADIVGELHQTYQHIFTGVGTGTTLAGLINGSTKSTMVHGIVTLKGAENLQNEVEALLVKQRPFRMHNDFHYGGYGKFDKELLGFIQYFTKQTGILLDPVYTAKMMKAIFTLAEEDYFKRGEKILALHTGGLWGLTSEKVYSIIL